MKNARQKGRLTTHVNDKKYHNLHMVSKIHFILLSIAYFRDYCDCKFSQERSLELSGNNIALNCLSWPHVIFSGENSECYGYTYPNNEQRFSL